MADAARHSLSDVDAAARTATCSVCGPVRIRVRKAGGASCWTRVIEGRRRYKAGAAGRANRERYRRNAGPRREYLRTTYGMSIAEWDAMLMLQSGRCAICSEPMLSPRVDHSHDTGAIRGLLCHACNIALGWMRDSPATALAAASYLARSQSPLDFLLP